MIQEFNKYRSGNITEIGIIMLNQFDNSKATVYSWDSNKVFEYENNIDVNSIHPIKLVTDSRLLYDYGFVNTEPNKNGVVIWKKEGLVLSIDDNDIKISIEGQLDEHPISYIHQLQNIHYDYLGKHLVDTQGEVNREIHKNRVAML